MSRTRKEKPLRIKRISSFPKRRAPTSSFDSTISSGTLAANSLGPSGTGRTPNNLPRNIISLVLDGQTTEGSNLKHVRDGMVKYIREHINDSDSVSLFAISGGLQLLQPFTQDKAKLIAAVERSEAVATTSKTSELRSLNESMAAIRDQLSTSSTGGAIDTPAGGSAAAQAMISRRVLEQYVQLRSV